jgi:hypothetical protein
MQRTRLDDQCLKIDECPMDEEHFYNSTERACLFSPNSTLSCSISIKSIEDLQIFSESECNVAEKFEIINLEDSMDEDVQKIIDEKLQNVVEIKECLIIKNSSAISSLNFLRNLRKIKGNCSEGGDTFSLMIADNKNLHTFIPNKFNAMMRVKEKVIVKNNDNLCHSELAAVRSIFENSTKFDVPDDGCVYGKLSIETFATENSALIMTDGVATNGFKFRLTYWRSSEEKYIE